MSDQVTGESNQDKILRWLGLAQGVVDGLRNPNTQPGTGPEEDKKPEFNLQASKLTVLIGVAVVGYFGYKFLKNKRYI